MEFLRSVMARRCNSVNGAGVGEASCSAIHAFMSSKSTGSFEGGEFFAITAWIIAAWTFAMSASNRLPAPRRRLGAGMAFEGDGDVARIRFKLLLMGITARGAGG